MGPVQNQLYSSFCAYLGALSFGITIGYSSPALPQMTSIGQVLYSNQSGASWFGSVVTLGAVIGCLLAGWMVERRGRKITLLFSSFPFLVGWLCIYLSELIEVLCFGRLLTGVGSGIILAAAPMYVAEVSTKDYRGMLGSGIQLSITLGILLIYTLGLVMNWHNLALISSFFPVAAFIATLRAPESQRFLLDAGRRTEAVSTLTWLRGSLSSAEEECRDMEEVHTTSTKQTTLLEILRHRELSRPMFLAVAVMVFQQISGINVVMFYSQSIFEAAGFKSYSGVATVMIGAVQVCGTAVACMIMDRYGRRKLLIFAGSGMMISCIGLGVYYKLSSLGSTDIFDLAWLAAASLICYILAFALGWGPIPMLLMSEIIPARARGPASAVTTVINWVFAFIVTKSFSSLEDIMGLSGTFWLFGACCMLAVLFVVKFVPETKGKSLEDIELFFIGHAPLV